MKKKRAILTTCALSRSFTLPVQKIARSNFKLSTPLNRGTVNRIFSKYLGSPAISKFICFFTILLYCPASKVLSKLQQHNKNKKFCFYCNT